MTGNKYLLDTNIISAYFKGDVSIANKINSLFDVFIPVIVIGELSYGAALSNNALKYLSDVEEAKNIFNIIPVDADTCGHYGSIKASLRKKGKPIPENDIWIAAIALQHNLVLVTRDNHFNEVEGLSTEHW
jgi:tRNA(fMet)-specific endonuclease VapC